MEAAAPAELSALSALDDELLYVFLAGPGKGEGILIKAPEFGWLAVDGCKAARPDQHSQLPLVSLLARFGAAPLQLYVLTHPHQDHTGGVAELLETYSPAAIAVTGPPSPGASLFDEYERRFRGDRSEGVAQALKAILKWRQDTGHPVTHLHDGVPLASAGRVAVTARAPDPGYLLSLGSPLAPADLNHLSAVLEVTFGTTRIVLGGDLPLFSHGWQHVLQKYPNLANHHGLKIPHHGSLGALHPPLLAHAKHLNAAWLLSPYNSSGLPRTDDDDGLDVLLQHHDPILLTAPSVSKKLQAAQVVDGRTRLQLATQTAATKKGRSILNRGTVVTPPLALQPQDAVWAVAFDHCGKLRGRWRGAAACLVYP